MMWLRIAHWFVFLPLLVARAASAQVDLGFETTTLDAWTVSAARAALDAETFFEGAQSLRIDGRGRVEQTVPTVGIAGNRIEISARIKADAASSAGLWVRVHGKDVRLFIDRARDRDSPESHDWRRYTVVAPLGPEAESLSFGLQVAGDGSVWFDALSLETSDTRAQPLPAPDAARYLDYALDLMEANSLMRRAVDWPGLRRRTIDQARGAMTPADTHLAIEYALGALLDGHSYFMSPEQNARMRTEPVANARTGRRLVAPHGDKLAEAISYVSLPGYAGGTQAQQVAFARSVHELIARLDHERHCGWVVDLRDNTGGNLWPMLAAIGPLLGDREAGAALHADGSRAAFWYRGGRAGLGDFVQLRVPAPAYELVAPEAPVAILIGPRTASSGEVIAAAFRGRARTASFGQATRGLSTGNRTFPLRDGGALVLTVAATSDASGRVLSGALEPDYAIAATPQRRSLSAQASVKAAVDWLNRECRAASNSLAHAARIR